MIGLGSSRPGRPSESFYFVFAFLLFTVILFALERARRFNNQFLQTPKAERPSSFFHGIKSPGVTIHHHSHQPKLAKALDPQDLLDRNLTTDQTTVPKLFHQSWADTDLPQKFQEWSRSCREVHPDWEWVLWTDKDNHDLVEKFAPWFLESYDSLASEIFRADAVRNIYMHVFGGVYADLDVECLRPTEQLLAEYNITGRKAYLGRMGTDTGSEHSIPNAWMTSTPAHPFWLLPLETIQRNIDSDMDVERVTGPVALREVVHEYENEFQGVDANGLDRYYRRSGWRGLYTPARGTPQSLHILPFWEIYPYSWDRDGQAFRDYCSPFEATIFNATKCKELVGAQHWGRNGSYTITYWSHSWDYGPGAQHDWEHLEKLMGSNGDVSGIEGAETAESGHGKEG